MNQFNYYPPQQQPNQLLFSGQPSRPMQLSHDFINTIPLADQQPIPMRLSQQYGNQIMPLCQRQMACQSKPMTQSFVDRIPYERSYVEFVPQQKIEMVPMEKKVQDFIEVQHDIDYIPVPRVEKYIEQVPVERYQTYCEYIPQERSYVKSAGVSGYETGYQGCVGGYSGIAGGQRGYGGYNRLSGYGGLVDGIAGGQRGYGGYNRLPGYGSEYNGLMGGYGGLTGGYSQYPYPKVSSPYSRYGRNRYL